jgi:predicted nucleic acid-binding protein
MQNIFVDTSAWIGLEAANDQRHQSAIAFKQGSGRAYRWVTTNWVIWETVTWLRMHVHHAAAVRFNENVRASKLLKLITVTAEYESLAWDLFKRYDDKEFSFVDCTSFAIMRSVRLVTAFAFDEHFQQMGFWVLPEAT